MNHSSEMRKTNVQAAIGAASKPLRIGFVPLSDCAPLVMAQELGLFAKYGLRVSLSRELGWATVRDKIVFGELDAAHAIAGLPFAATLGLGSVKCPCVTGVVLNLHGNAITLSTGLADLGVQDVATLRELIHNSARDRTLTFGVVHPFSSHYFLLRQWLASGGINPDRDVRIVVVPPPQMFVNLKAGHLDGYCVGEPWNSVAVRAGIGWCASVSAELAPGHPEKALIVREVFAETHAAEHEALIAALLEACEYCDVPGNREEIVNVLARREYVNAPPASLRPSLSGRFEFKPGQTRQIANFDCFWHDNANEPSAEKAAWLLNNMRAAGLLDPTVELPASFASSVFRHDIFERASVLRSVTPHPIEHEPKAPTEYVHS